MSRIKKAYGFEWEEAPIDDKKQIIQIKNEKANKIKWGNTGNIYWVGHDIMWTIDAIWREAPLERIKHGLEQILHHLRSMHFQDSQIEQTLTNMIEKIQDKDLTRINSKALIAGSLIQIRDIIGKLAENNQPDYKSGPE